MKNMNTYEPFASEIDSAFEEFTWLQQNREALDPDADSSDDEEPSASHNLPVLPPDVDDPCFQVDIGIDLGIQPTHNEQDDIAEMPHDMQDEEYFKLLGKLNTKQQEFHTHVMRVASQSNQVMCVLHRGAGTGKINCDTGHCRGITMVSMSTARERLFQAPTACCCSNRKGCLQHQRPNNTSSILYPCQSKARIQTTWV